MKTLIQLIKRNIKIFLRDKMGVFFSLLAPIIVLMLFILFLGDIQADSAENIVNEYLGEGVVATKYIKALVNSWMVAGVIGVGCLTVALSALVVIIRDRETKVCNDYIASPVKRSTVNLAYFLGVFIVTVVIMLIVTIVALLYLVISNNYYLSFGDLLATIGLVILGCASSSLILMVLTLFIKTEGTHGAFTGIVCAVSGFLIGAYMPVSIFPKPIQYISNLLPGSHVSGLLRRTLLNGVMGHISESGEAATSVLSEYFSLELNFFGKTIETSGMLIYLVASTIVFLVVNIFLVTKRDLKTA